MLISSFLVLMYRLTFCTLTLFPSPPTFTTRSYGPFWVATTLVFVTAAAGNLYSYVNYRKSSSSSPPPADANSTAVPAPSGGTSPTDVVTNQWFADPTKVRRGQQPGEGGMLGPGREGRGDCMGGWARRGGFS